MVPSTSCTNNFATKYFLRKGPTLSMELQNQLEGLPGYDVAQLLWEEFAGKKFQTKDPYEDENGNRRRLPSICTREEQKVFRSIQKRAWLHDKCFLGSCGVGLDCGLGLAPLLVLFIPVFGPLLMYVIHLRLVKIASDRFQIPAKLDAKLNANIGFDLLITFPPIIGVFFGWLNQCSTRNAALIHDYMIFAAEKRLSGPKYGGTGFLQVQPAFGTQVPENQNYHQIDNSSEVRGNKKKGSKQVNAFEVSPHQQMGYV